MTTLKGWHEQRNGTARFDILNDAGIPCHTNLDWPAAWKALRAGNLYLPADLSQLLRGALKAGPTGVKIEE